MDILKLKCKVCGETFSSQAAHAKYCQTCRAMIVSIRGSLRYKGEKYTFDDCIRVAKERLAHPSGSRSGNIVRCKYCGKNTTSATGFCTTCRHEGYDDIFRVTGRSNGWETERAHGHCASGGWRGQRIMGGGAATWFPGRMDWLGR